MTHKDLANPIYMAWRAYLEMTERRHPEELTRAGVIRALTWAYENTAGYRELYEFTGVSPRDLRTLDDLRYFPTIDKSTMRLNVERYSVPIPGRTRTTTGGSTGEPFGFWRDPLTFGRELASKAHQYRRIGWKEGDRQLTLRGLVIDTPTHMEYVPELEELCCSSYHLTPEWMVRYYEAALEYEPQWIRCYPSSGYVFARWLAETGRRFPPLKGILCASEHLYDFQRELLSRVFGGRIFSHYGHYECAVLAGYCEGADTYHVLPQYGYAELLDMQGEPVTEPGQVGEIVATSFIMHATPMIRYRTGDLARFAGWGCPACERNVQVWERIEGRLQEIVLTATGRPLSTSMLNMHDDTYAGIQRFRFRQREPGELIFEYIPQNGDSSIAQRVERRFAAKLGDDMQLVAREVSELPQTERGKHRLLVQEMDLSYDHPSLQQPLRLR